MTITIEHLILFCVIPVAIVSYYSLAHRAYRFLRRQQMIRRGKKKKEEMRAERAARRARKNNRKGKPE